MILSYTFPVLKITISLLRDCWGVFNKPYETIRTLSVKKQITPILFFALLSWIYLGIAVSIKFGIHTGAIFLTFNLGRLFYAVSATFFIVTATMYLVGRIMGGKGNLLSILSVWSYSYLPTLIWFLLTTFLYIVLPPPRTNSVLGNFFSVIYLFISLGLIFWKGLLYFLTLRFCLKLNLWQTTRTTIVLWSLWFLYFLLLNRMGIFKIPFA